MPGCSSRQRTDRRHLAGPAAMAAGDSGVTLLELVVVLFIVGIVTVSLLNQVKSSRAELLAQTETVKFHLRYAQLRAMNSEVVWGIEFFQSAGAFGYRLFKDTDEDKTVDTGGSVEERVLLPGADGRDVPLSDKFAVTTGIVSFDPYGRPYNHLHKVTDDPTDSCFGEASSGSSLTLTYGGSDSETIDIETETGFIR